jgi:hypothetical protein
MPMDEFDLITKLESETATIEEIETNLPIRFHTKSKLTSMVKPDELKVDMSYQRSVSPDRVSSIAKNFNQQALGIVTLSIRENGELYIIDGQHRIEALKKMGKGNIQINAVVLFDLSIQDEANLFLIMNDNRTKPKKYDLHKAASASGNEITTSIDATLASLGLRIFDRPGDGNIRAVGTVHKVSSKIGLEKLEKVLKVMMEANGSHSSSLKAEYIEAVSAIIVQFKDVDMKRLSMAIRNIGDTSSSVLKASVIAVDSRPISKILALAGMIIDAYNYKLRNNRLDKFKILSLDARNYLNGGK